MNINTKKIALERAKQGLTIIELSKKAGVHKQTISRIENNVLKPRIDTVGKIANALGKSLEDFIEI